MNNINNYKISFFDFIGVIASGLLIGYERQLLADSGQYNSNKVFVSMPIAGGSYLLAFVLFHRSQLLRVPSWIIISLFGSILCFLNLHVVKYAVDNWSYGKGVDLEHYITGFFIITPIYSLIALIIIGAIHFVGRLLVKFIFEPNAVNLK
jgi:hypothetical protein